eukprot:5180869-Pyramimonas_sp.AAC.1
MLDYTWDRHLNIANALASDMKPPVRALSGHRFSARVGHAGRAFQRPKLLAVLFDDTRGDPRAPNPLEQERPALGDLLERPLSLLEVGARCSHVLTPLLMKSTSRFCAESSLSSCIASSSSFGTLSLFALGSDNSGL